MILLLSCATPPPPDPSWPARLDRDRPGLLGPLAALRFGAPRAEVCPAVPELCADPPDLRLGETPVRELQALFSDGAEPGLLAIVVLVPEDAPLAARWGPSTGDPPRWLGDGLRARLDHGRATPNHATVWVEPMLVLDDIVGPQASFGTGTPLLGLAVDGLRAAYAPWIVRSTPDRAWLHLWPLGDGFADVLLIADLADGAVRGYTFDLALGERPDRAAVISAFQARFGPPVERDGELAWASTPPIRVEGGAAAISVHVGSP